MKIDVQTPNFCPDNCPNAESTNEHKREFNFFQKVVNMAYFLEYECSRINKENQKEVDKALGNAIRRGMTCLTCVGASAQYNGLYKCDLDDMYYTDDHTCKYWEVD